MPPLPLLWLLVSDIDDTFLGHDADPLDAEAAARLLRTLHTQPPIAFVLNSSRPAPSVARTLAAHQLPSPPDGLITAMGTEISLHGKPDLTSPERFQNWDRAAVVQVMLDLGATPHPDEFQTPFKASFALPPERRDTARNRLEFLGLDLQIIASGASDFDVIPARAGKGQATLRVASRLGIDPERHLLVTADSRNDLAMFDVCPRGIVAGNVRDELRSAVDPARAFLASAPRAAGILQGLAHWGALPASP